MTEHTITVSGYAGSWVASCECGWVGNAYRSSGPLNAKPKAEREHAEHVATVTR